MGTARIALRRIIVEERVELVLADSYYRRWVLVKVFLGSLIKRSLAEFTLKRHADGLGMTKRKEAQVTTLNIHENETFGTAPAPASSWKKGSAVNPNIPATALFGKTATAWL